MLCPRQMPCNTCQRLAVTVRWCRSAVHGIGAVQLATPLLSTSIPFNLGVQCATNAGVSYAVSSSLSICQRGSSPNCKQRCTLSFIPCSSPPASHRALHPPQPSALLCDPPYATCSLVRTHPSLISPPLPHLHRSQPDRNTAARVLQRQNNARLHIIPDLLSTASPTHPVRGSDPPLVHKRARSPGCWNVEPHYNAQRLRRLAADSCLGTCRTPRLVVTHHAQPRLTPLLLVLLLVIGALIAVVSFLAHLLPGAVRLCSVLPRLFRRLSSRSNGAANTPGRCSGSVGVYPAGSPGVRAHVHARIDERGRR